MELAPLALLAGLLSITSPCILPLIPGYLSYISGVSAGSIEQRGQVLGTAALFTLGFGATFTALGASASFVGAVLLGAAPVLIKVAGAFVLLMGLAMLGLFRLPFLYKEKRMDLARVRPGPLGAFPLGVAFAFGWTPCIGPILGGIYTAAAATQTVGEGAALLAVYSAGMGIPFMLAAWAYTRSKRLFDFFKKHGQAMERAGGGLLVIMGILLITGFWTRLFVPIMRLFAEVGWPPI